MSLEERYDEVRQLIAVGKEKGYLLYDEVNELLTNQTNLTTAFATGGIEHSLSTGIEFIYERHGIHPSVASGTQAPANLYNPSTADSFSSFVRSGAYSEGKTTTGGLYVFDNLRFNDQWSLNAGVRFDKLVVVGGAIRNKFWMQNKADVTGRCIEAPAIEDASPLGAAMLAGIGVGVYANEEDAFRQVYRPGAIYEPNPAASARYAELFPIYKQLYAAVAPVNHQLYDRFLA